ncbi:MAG: hypothetical protein HYX72_11435 [Acidobacteria bacterium]|nr:hypothetical protein [Acidobacteriota bacterium]
MIAGQSVQLFPNLSTFGGLLRLLPGGWRGDLAPFDFVIPIENLQLAPAILRHQGLAACRWVATLPFELPVLPLFNNAKYPTIVEDFEHTFKVLKSLPCDVFFYVRATTIRLDEKEKKLKAGVKPNPFIDPQGCKDYIAENENLYRKPFAEQKALLAKKK